jgi:hypothetical protein
VGVVLGFCATTGFGTSFIAHGIIRVFHASIFDTPVNPF